MRIMTRSLWGALLIAAVAFQAAQAGERTYTYVGDAPIVHYNTYRVGTFDLAIHLCNPALTGKKVTKIRAQVNSMTQQVDECRLWLSSELKIENIDGKKLNAPDICSNLAVPDEEGWMEVTLEEPYTLTDKGVFAGYSFHSPLYDDGARGPIMYSQSRHAGGFWFYSRLLATRWMDYEESLKGVLPIYVTVEGEFGEYEVSPAEWDTCYPFVETGSDYSLPLKVYNTGDKEVTSLDITFNADEKYVGSTRVELPEPLLCNVVDPYVINVAFPASSLIGKQNLSLSIDKVDGVDNASDRKGAVLPVEFRPFVPVKCTVLEEATGTWCSACPRGWAAIEALKKLYPNRFIAVAYHEGKDPMKTGAVPPFEIPHFPSAVLDRGDVIDPFYGDDRSQNDKFAIRRLVDEALRIPANAGISVTGQWLDESHNAISALAEVKFTENTNPDGFKVAFVLTIDGLKGDTPFWWQVNSANGNAPDALGSILAPLGTMGNPIMDMTYDHVALIGNPENALAVDATVAPLLSQELSYTFDMADAVSVFEGTKDESLVQNHDNLHVVALLLNADGKVVNASESSVSGYAGMTVPDIVADVTSTEYYDLYGRHVSSPVGVCGVLIRVEHRTDGSVSIKKIIR